MEDYIILQINVRSVSMFLGHQCKRISFINPKYSPPSSLEDYIIYCDLYGYAFNPVFLFQSFNPDARCQKWSIEINYDKSEMSMNSFWRCQKWGVEIK
ncbi:hypothetical protein C5167_007874 [Papaver somniferum]|nr:hypothetical protein C5167_007874 [Papaver somniferum]